MEENYKGDLIKTYEQIKEFVEFLEVQINNNKQKED